jgi:hypothetical protein
MCGEELVVREVTPCIDCGALEEQVNLLKQDIAEGFAHDAINFNEYRVFGDVEATFCDFCAVDFGSYDPTYFGLPKGARFGYEKMQFLKSVDRPSIGRDKYCPACNLRLAFMKFAFKARDENAI